MPVRNRHGGWPVCLALLSCLLLPACFDQPVVERMEFVFRPDGHLEIGVSIRISDDPDLQGNSRVKDRLAGMRDSVLRGEDEWSRSMASLEPVSEFITWELREGRLVEARRRVDLDDSTKVEEFFTYTPLGAFLDIHEGLHSLEFIPTGTTLATPKQERRVRESLEGFTGSFADYLQDTAEFYAYLETNPDRALPCFGELFGEDRGRLSRQETDLVESVSKGIETLIGVLAVEKTEAFTLNEMSRRVFNPFPAALEIEVPGTIEEVVGFREMGENRFSSPEISLFGAIVSLGQEWLRPNLVPIAQEWLTSEDDAGPTVEEIAAMPRFAGNPPAAAELRTELEMALRPLDSYRLSWRATRLPPGS